MSIAEDAVARLVREMMRNLSEIAALLREEDSNHERVASVAAQVRWLANDLLNATEQLD